MKVALVTGAVRRVGSSLAMFLAQRGYAIALHYHRGQEEAQETQQKIQSHAVACECFQANLSSAADVAQLMPRVIQSMGEVDVLINNVSVFNPPDLMRTTEAQFDYDMAVNLRCPFFLTQAFARQFIGKRTRRAGEGLIINMLDTRITKLDTDYCVYMLGKQALTRLTLVAAKSLAPEIRVNALAPGPALPPPGASSAHLDEVARKTPLGITSPPETLVAGLEYLLGARTVTGQILFIDSGQHL